MARKTRTHSEGLQYLLDRYIGDDPRKAAQLAEARTEAEVAMALYQLRTRAGLTQQELAKRAGTTASVISRLENADYHGHSLTMLRRIAAALGHRVEVRFSLEVKRPASKSTRAPAPAKAKGKPKRRAELV